MSHESDDYTDIDIKDNEQVCPRCRLVHLAATAVGGVCPDCHAEKQ